MEALLGSGSGDDWFGLFTALNALVPTGIEADFQAIITPAPGETLEQFIAVFAADGSNRVFTDESDSSGNPLGAHPGFVSVSVIVPGVPMVSGPALALLVLMVGTAAWFILRRRPSARAG